MTARRALLSAAALVLAAGLPALSPQAQAADPPGSTELVVVQADLDLYASPVGGERTRFPTFGATSVTASRDGSRLASHWTLAGGAFEVRDIGGAQVDVAQQSYDSSYADPELSPSGDRYSFLDDVTDPAEPVLHVRTLNGASPRTRAFRYDERVGADSLFLTEDLLLLEEDDPAVVGTAVTRFRTLSLDGSAPRPVVGLRDTAGSDLAAMVVDPTGTRLAYVRTPTGGGPRSLEVAPLSITAPRVTVGAPTVLATGAIGQAAFRRDSSAVIFVSGASPSRDLLTVSVSGGAALPFGPLTPTVDEAGVAFGVKGPVVTPAPPTVGRAELNGAFAAVRYTTSDPRSRVVRYTRTSPGLPTVAGSASTGLVLESELVLGRAYTYAFRAVDRSGNESEPRTLRPVATAPPSLKVPDPTTEVSATTTFPVGVVPAGNAPSTRYSVDQRDTAATAWTRWFTLRTRFAFDIDLGGDTVALFGTPADGDQAGTTSTSGRTYAFRGQAIDVHGNATAPVTSQRAVVPFDQARAGYRGDTRVVGRGGAFGGDTVFLRSAGAAASTVLVGDRFQVIGERHPTTGELDVFLDGVRQARVDTRADSGQPRRVLWSRTLSTPRRAVLTVRAVGTPGRPTVVLDAFSSRRFVDNRATLSSGGQLLRGQQLSSPNDFHDAVLQAKDGNFVVYPAATPALRTKVAATRIAVGRDGNLVAYAGSTPVAQSGTAGNGPSTLVMQGDGNLVLYRHADGRPTWSSRSGRTP